MVNLERADIQGFALYSYSNLSCAAYALLRIEDAAQARAWLGRVAERITPADGPRSPSVNLALTWPGLERLGLPAGAAETFPHAFRDGMASERRARILGDDGPNSPGLWRWGNAERPVDVLLLLFTEDEAGLEAEIARQRADWSAGGLVEVDVLGAGRQPDSKEHFGWVDGAGQPTIEGTDLEARQRARTGHATPLKPGEFLLSYEDTYGKPAPSPTVPAADDPSNALPAATGDDAASAGRRVLGRNGSYLVFRQLAQDVAGFWTFLEDAARRVDGTSDMAAQVRLGSKIVGRWPSGAPLVNEPERDPHGGVPSDAVDNDFEYAAHDLHGFRCPVGSHIRRANPRDALGPDPATALASARRHRIMRRGRSYGERLKDIRQDDGKERGLHFICLNSDLERQFEFVQQTWINNPVFGGLLDETDPLVGRRTPAGERDGTDEHAPGNTMTIQAEPVRTRVHGLRDFVTMRGGSYFFLPGIRALRYLASLTGDASGAGAASA